MNSQKRSTLIVIQTVIKPKKKRKLDIEWCTPNGVRADYLDEELIAEMKASGCRRIPIAPESVVQRIVNQVIGKKQDLKKVKNAVAAAKKVGIEVGCFFILGLIGETKEEMKHNSSGDRFHFSYANPLYGTELYEQAQRGGFLKPVLTDEALAAVVSLIETSEFTADNLRTLCAEVNIVHPTRSRKARQSHTKP